MHLESLEILGFKSFARKTNLVFPKGITCIVGPNGCGKSNITDCIRWILGEQSLKNLRASKNEDLIFSAGNKRLSLSQASLVIKDERNGETKITRRFFRNGENEYLINNKKVKREDFLFYLAQANVGQKGYSVLSQGMVDWILYSSKQERKDFFDEATGIREYQLKKNKAVSKIKKSVKNLQQAEIAIKEVEPRMKFLSRQIKKWEKRQEIEKKLVELERKYYSARLFKLRKEKNKIDEQFNEKSLTFKKEEKELKDFQEKFGNLVGYQPSEELKKIQGKWQELVTQRNKLLEEQANHRAKPQIQKENISVKEKNWRDLEEPLKKLVHQQEELLKKIDTIKTIEEVKILKSLAQKATVLAKEMLSFFVQSSEDKEMIKQELINDNYQNAKIVELNKEIKELENKLNKFFELENQKRKEMFEIQRQLQSKQDLVSSLGHELKDIEMQRVKLETKEEDLKEEIKKEAFNKEITFFQELELSYQEEEDLLTEINKIKKEIDLIGGFDESFLQEYNECREKYEFLSTQINDLKSSIISLEDVRKKLDEKIKKEFFINFNKINKYFEEYFKFLFRGGSAKLVLEEDIGVQSKSDEVVKNKKEDNQEQEMEEDEEINKEIKYGVEIYARPPQKKNKTIQSLSGGEKALTSIALICAIIKTENPPFVILDEVDAALDEANSIRLTEIIKELSKKTQSIIVTHNPVTMEAASALYGVTLDKEGSSHLVSMKLVGN